MAPIIVIGMLVLFVVIVAVVVANRVDNAAQVRELDYRTHAAQRQVHQIGERTRAAIRAEALRRRQQGE